MVLSESKIDENWNRKLKIKREKKVGKMKREKKMTPWGTFIFSTLLQFRNIF